MTIVLTFGTFDGLHAGHEHFLKQAKALGDRLVVSLAPDKVVKELKGHSPQQSFRARKKALLGSGIVDAVEEGDRALSSYKVLTRVAPDVIALGYDQNALAQDLLQLEHLPRLERLEAYRADVYKSSLLNQTV